MALNIPLPGTNLEALLKGVSTGSSAYSNAMQPILDREKQAQLERHFQEQLKLSKAASGRNAELFKYRLQELQDKHAAAQFERNLMQQLMGGGQMPEGGGEAMPNDLTGEGMGAFSPEGLQARQGPQGGQAAGGENSTMLNALKQNPMLRGWFKHKFGYDPLAQTPEDKQDAALDLFQKKEAIKMQNKGGDTPTNTVLTQNQQSIQGIDTVLPMLDELINDPSKVYGRFDFSPSKKAAYNAKTSGMIDTLVAAQSLPKVQASIDLVEQQIRRATNEGDDAYLDRLRDLRKDLVNRRSKAQSVLKSRKVNTAALEDFSKMSEAELLKIAGGG